MKKIVSAVMMIIANIVFAELLIYEGFDYEAVGDVGDGSTLTNGYGWSEGSSWSRQNASKDHLYIYENSLSYGGVVTTGNKYALGGTNGRYSNRSFADIIDLSVSDVIWGGVIMKTLSSTKTGRSSRFKLNNGTTNGFYVFADSMSTIKVGGGDAVEIDSGINPGTSVRLYVYKLDLSGEQAVAELWISPSDISSEATLGFPDITITNIASVYTSFALGNSGGNPGYYDEIRIGTEFEDAVYSLPPVIPQGTVLLIN